MTARKQIVLDGPDGTLVVFARDIGRRNETVLIMRARDWARRMYGQTSPCVDSVRVVELGPRTGRKT